MLKTAIKSLVGAGLAVVAASSTLASPVLIPDNYVGADAHGYGDRIGDSRYEVQGMEVSFDANYMDVRIRTNFYEGPGAYGTLFGDLFISTDGWQPFGTAPYTADNASNGEDWEYVFDTSANSLYGGNFSILLSDSAPPEVSNPSGFIVRNGQEVLRNTDGMAIAGSSVDLSHAGNGGYIDYRILLSSLNLTGDAQVGLRWAMTCANDAIEGQVGVPEPGALALFGLGLVGLGFVRRRKTT